jgi:nicotinate phosphoribosyltransferase
VGTKLVTAHDDPSLDGVYKIMAKKTKTGYEPLIKVSNNPEKTSIPGIKNVLRLYDEEDIMLGDLVFLEEERKEIEKKLERNEPFEYFHPKIPYQYKTIDDYKKGEFLLKPVMENGRIQYEFPSLNEIREKKKKSFDQLHSSHKRLLNPHIYKVSLSEKLSTLRVDMIKEYLKEMK